ncbi:MAG: adenylate cyclase class 1 [Oleiphilaceae bacterium]|jgi:adenylate cyclase class 1
MMAPTRKHKYKHKLSPDFTEGVDRKLLKQVRDRFMAVNADRLDKTLQGLTSRQQDIVRVLPLLYQVNHPLLPGYVSRSVPVGVSGYEPDKTTLSIAKTFSNTFKFRHDKRTKAEIFSIFMMGSTGTLAHSEVSDVDLWLCHAPDLLPESLALLDEKAKKIDAWANNSGLELHTFLMNAEQFKTGGKTPDMDTESSGSAQHYLLLDEFYRTAILLVGRYPLWWLIPPNMEKDYQAITNDLLTKRFVKDTEVLDFGSAASIPKNELMGAGLWQLYKGIDSPYKSVLKLLLAEVYAQELPHSSSLSQTFKQAVYDDELNVEDLDPYVLIYHRLERYLLARKDHKRLDLVRKSFYIKVAKKLSKRPSGRTASWQRQTLERIVKHWAWPDSKLKYLDERSNWKVDQVTQERHEVVTELSHCYRFLSNYARAHDIKSSITAKDLNLLGRKLNATFQRKAGKVELINPGIAANLWEENLAIHHSSSQVFNGDKNCWLLYRDLQTASDASFQTNLTKTSNLTELLAWLYFNGIINHETRLSLLAGESQINLFTVQNMIRVLEEQIPLPLEKVPQAKFQNPAYVKSLVLFINVGVDPMATMSERGMHRLSNRNDSLDYSTERSNLVKTIDQITLNSWNEITTHRYEMGETLMQNLQSYLQVCLEQLATPGASECRFTVHCFCPHRAQAISDRVRKLFTDTKSAFFVNGKVRQARYIIDVEDKIYVLQRIDEQFRYIAFESKKSLFVYLSQNVRHYSPIIIDAFALQKSLSLRAALTHSRYQCIQVFYSRIKTDIDVIILDEHGSLLCFSMPCSNEEVFQSSISQFINAVIEKRQLNESIEGKALTLSYSLYTMTQKNISDYAVKEVKQIPRLAFHEVHIATNYSEGERQLDASVNHKVFSFFEYGEQQLAALCHFVKNDADMDNRLPIQVTDMTLSEDPNQQRSLSKYTNNTLEYLRLYAQVEAKLAKLR